MFSKIFSPFGRWLLSSSLFGFITAYYGIMLHGFDLLTSIPHYEIALFVTFLVYLTIGYLGFQAWKITFQNNVKTNLDPGFFVAELCMGIGLLGTIMGMITVLGVFDNVGTIAIKEMINDIGAGVGTAQTTIFCGIAGAILVRMFLAFTFGAWFRKGE